MEDELGDDDLNFRDGPQTRAYDALVRDGAKDSLACGAA